MSRARIINYGTYFCALDKGKNARTYVKSYQFNKPQKARFDVLLHKCIRLGVHARLPARSLLRQHEAVAASPASSDATGNRFRLHEGRRRACVDGAGVRQKQRYIVWSCHILERTNKRLRKYANNPACTAKHRKKLVSHDKGVFLPELGNPPATVVFLAGRMPKATSIFCLAAPKRFLEHMPS